MACLRDDAYYATLCRAAPLSSLDTPNLDKPEAKFQPQRRRDRKEKRNLCALRVFAVKILGFLFKLLTG